MLEKLIKPRPLNWTMFFIFVAVTVFIGCVCYPKATYHLTVGFQFAILLMPVWAIANFVLMLCRPKQGYGPPASLWLLFFILFSLPSYIPPDYNHEEAMKERDQMVEKLTWEQENTDHPPKDH